MLNTMAIFGTRPETIKLAPVISKLELHGRISNKVVVTAQHRQMLDQALHFFNIKVDYDLNIMKKGQSLFDITCAGLTGIREVLQKEKPDIVLVQGDTTTTFLAGLGAFYLKIPIAHVEAGLRTNNKYRPFPEEINRRLTSHLADIHFAPTERAKNHLLSEGICEEKIFITGNTVIDAIKIITNRLTSVENLENLEKHLARNFGFSTRDSRLILVTGHRRENFGRNLENICHALKEVALGNSDVQIIYPMHMNPNVRQPVKKILDPISNIHLTEPIEYFHFVYLMSKSYLILTDSGGIQEEAPALGKPVLVMRKVTERPEVIEAGAAKLVGTNKKTIVREIQTLLEDNKAYQKMSKKRQIYGNGRASEKIVETLLSEIDHPR